MRKLAVAVILSSLALSGPALADVPAPAPGAVRLLWSPAQIAKARQEIGIQEARVKELQPVVQHDIQARQDFNADATNLDRNAKEMRARATDYQSAAATLTGKDRDDLLAFVRELETFARHDEENAKIKRDFSHKLDDVIKSEQAAIQWHLEVAMRLKTALANNS